MRHLPALLIAVLTLLTAPVQANICPAYQPKNVNGCSTEIPIAITFLNGDPVGTTLLLKYSYVFNSSCDKHDRCYERLGSDSTACDSTFRSEMRGQCDSKFKSRWWDPTAPIELAECRAAADAFYSAVRLWDSSSQRESSGWGLLQRYAANGSTAMAKAVREKTCGTTPALSGVYDNRFISLVNSAFYAGANRYPTTYEFFDAVDSAVPSVNYNNDAQMISNVAAYARTRIQYIPIPIAYQFSQFDGQVEFRASFFLPGASYEWYINGSLLSAPAPGLVATKTLPYVQKGILKIPYRGFLRVAFMGQADLVIIDKVASVVGECGTTGVCY